MADFPSGSTESVDAAAPYANAAIEKAMAALYRAENNELTSWKFLRILFEHPDQSIAGFARGCEAMLTSLGVWKIKPIW